MGSVTACLISASILAAHVNLWVCLAVGAASRRVSVLLAVKFDVRKDEQRSHPLSADDTAARTYVPHTLAHSHP